MPLNLTLVGTTDSQNPLAHPRYMVTIKEGTPYTVPTAKIFVLTGLGTVALSTATVIPVAFASDSVVQIRAGIFGAGQTTVQAGTDWYSGVASCAQVPPCISFAAGKVLTVDDGTASNNGRAYGYLAPA